MKLENEQDKLKKQKTKQEIRIALQKALQEKMERMQQEYREEQDLNMKLMQNALQNLQDETDKKKQKKVRHLLNAFYVLERFLGSVLWEPATGRINRNTAFVSVVHEPQHQCHLEGCQKFISSRIRIPIFRSMAGIRSLCFNKLSQVILMLSLF